ncbi:TPA: ash family protein [Escherichia coli]|nr:ash family protein [Escherichia coli]HBA9581642.1 ash family protein [Escherichia coli]HBA9585546.1 ash family protein [Escherichia coli]
MNITKSAPLLERPCEQLTYCAVCVCDPKHKHGNDSRYQAGGQCDQPGGLLLVAFLRRGYCVTKSSRANFSGGINCGFGLVFRIFSSSARSRSLVSSCFCRMISLTGVFSPFSDDDVCSFIVLPCKAMRRSSSHHGADSGYSCSLTLRRWRRLISPLTAVTINCALLSPSSKFFSKSATTSCGNLAFNCCDLLFVEPVAITESSLSWCDSVYTKKNSEKGLKCDSLVDRLKTDGAMHQITTPRSAGTHAGRLTTNDNQSIEVAMRNHTTHPQGRDSHNLNKYIWRFIALSTAQPRVIHIEATSEQEARQQSPDGCVMVFAARIRQEVRHD